MFAAVPTAHQPCGANGDQPSPARDGNATAVATATTTISTAESASWKPDEMRSPSTLAPTTVVNIARPTTTATAVPPPTRSAT